MITPTLAFIAFILTSITLFLLYKKGASPLVEKQLEKVQDEVVLLREENTRLREQIKVLETQNTAEKKFLEEKLHWQHLNQEKLLENFKQLAQSALVKNQESFLSLSDRQMNKWQEGASKALGERQEAISNMLKPLNETLEKLNKQKHQDELAWNEVYGSLQEQLKLQGEAISQLHKETSTLSQSLQNPTVRGRWGEVQLKRVVELAGMVAYCDFVEQTHVDSEQGRLRPDMLIRLPNGREVIIDAKTPLLGYLESCEAKDEEQRKAKLKVHSEQIRRHFQQLGAKSYWQQFKTTPEFVVMFLPGEIFFSAALEQDPALIEKAAEHKVILATPTTLIALLKAIAFGWRQHQASENTEKITELGKTLYSRLHIMSKHLMDMRKHLERTLHSFNKTTSSFESRVLSTARRFNELGTSDTPLPQLESIDTLPKVVSEVEE